MRVCAVYGEVLDAPVEADMHEVRIDVFGFVLDWTDENTIVTMAGRIEVRLPEGFKGLMASMTAMWASATAWSTPFIISRGPLHFRR